MKKDIESIKLVRKLADETAGKSLLEKAEEILNIEPVKNEGSYARYQELRQLKIQIRQSIASIEKERLAMEEVGTIRNSRVRAVKDESLNKRDQEEIALLAAALAIEEEATGIERNIRTDVSLKKILKGHGKGRHQAMKEYGEIMN